MDTLWGKYHTTGVTLLDHTKAVVEAAEALFGTATGPTRLGECWLRFFKLPKDEWERFYWNLLASALLHDWGKANDGMQAVLTGKGPQAIRHEHFSALLVAQPVFWSWLGRQPKIDREMVFSAVMTHHLKATFDAAHEYGFATEKAGAKGFCSIHDHADFARMVDETERRLEIGAAVESSSLPKHWMFEGPIPNVTSERKRLKGTLNQFQNLLEDDPTRRQLLHAVRSALIAADAAGSGLPRTGLTIKDWIAGTFDESKLWDDKSVRESIIDPRKIDLERQRGRFKWNDFQDHCADAERVPARTLLLAPCGSGKTLAAWRWIEQQAKGRVGHVLFLYPTRTTATEGFRDYVSWAPDAEAALMHGTSGFDLEEMFDNAPDEDLRKTREYRLSDAEKRLFALGHSDAERR